MLNGVPREVARPKPKKPQARGFLPQDFLRDNIYSDKSKAFPHIFILLSSWTRQEGFLSLAEYHGQYTGPIYWSGPDGPSRV